MICPRCGAQIMDNATFCNGCGANIQEAMMMSTGGRKPYPRNASGKEIRGERVAMIGVIFSIFVPGLGTWFGGNFIRSLLLFFGTIAGLFAVPLLIMAATKNNGSFLFMLVGFAIWIYAIIDAYLTCKKTNQLWYEYQDSL